MTNKTAWTPGPWVVRDMHEITTLKHGVKIADATCRYSTLNEAQHNAQLIALAPEMAEALREIEDTADCAAGCHDDVMQDALKECRALARSILSRLPVAK